MNNPHVIDKRTVKLEEMKRQGFIPFMGGRPMRETIINNDDILNLTILMNTTASVEDLLQTIH
jgi:hypothetical protein